MRRTTALVATALLVTGATPRRTPAPQPAVARSALAVRVGGAWRPFWSSDRAPARWAGGHPVVARALNGAWRDGAAGMRWAELELSGSGEAWRTRVVVARLDPRRVRLELANGVAPGGLAPTWTVGQAPDDAVLAINAGQFSGSAVWGWVVHDGEEYRAPGRGPLAAAVVSDTAGRVHFEGDAALARRRSAGGAGVDEGFQSFPLLLEGDGAVPRLLREPGPFIDLEHRDARLALGELRDGTLLVVLTRFDALGPAFGGVPFGLTVPEMAGLMGALGCRRAVALDGGVSAQLLLRDAAGERHTWRGLREVPLGLVVRPR